MSGRLPHPALAGPPLAFAHRGHTPTAHDPDGSHAWENTVAAFEAAVALGITHLETDVHATRDGVAVVLHDPDLRRTTGRPGRVERLTWREVATYRVAGLHAVPRVEEVLEALPGVVLNVDVKAAAAAVPLADAVRHARAEDRVVVAAFDGRRARAAQRAAPGVARSAGTASVAATRLATEVARVSAPAARALVRATLAGADALQVPLRARRVEVVTPLLLDVVHEVGAQVHVWTVDDPAEMHRLLDLGVDGLMSDRADVLARVMNGRGHGRAL
ncbi:glycerophosphodiester phosphodiesterase family protein [Aquipuribacter nitratireducens]|uniref:Glycerophosphodiester phosphodiesterase family protein n=1 Tax=Aquipuribacter nitratireducens TaxID=650104 RepID=A0ABW0GJM3_9MICO